jgi:histidine triad (HIT) family protein
MSTIFSKIIDGEIPADFVYQDEHCIVINDLYPKAPVHMLMIPRKPIVNLDDLSEDDQALMGQLMLTIPKVAKQQGLEAGYRTIINTNKGGGQEIFHLHIHILGGGGPLPFA